MPRPKKVVEEVEVVEVTPSGVAPITTDFGRADLNELAAKLNEVIEKING